MRTSLFQSRAPLTAVLALSTLVPALSATASEHDLEDGAKRLRGDYGMTASYSCARTPFLPPGATGIDPATKQLLVAADVAHAVGTGVMRFSPDGTVSVDVDGVELETAKTQPGQRPVTAGIKYQCDGSYTARADGRLAVEFPTCTVSSPQPGVTVTVGPLVLAGFVGKHADALNLSAVNAAIEKVTVAAGGHVVQERERVCVASFSLVELRKQDRR